MVAFDVSTLDDGRTQATFTISGPDNTGKIWTLTDSLVMSPSDWAELSDSDRDAQANARLANKILLWTAPAAAPAQSSLSVDTTGVFQPGETVLQSATGATATVVKSYSGRSSDGKTLLVIASVTGAFAVGSVVSGMQSQTSGNVTVLGG